MFPDALCHQAATLLEAYRRAGWRLVTVESCTGGLLAALLTEIAGSSDVLERGFVTYSNEAKSELVEVPAALIGRRGAVSAEVAEAMAAGGLARSRAEVAIAITGIAGPGGGSADKPVGLVYFGLCTRAGAPRHDRRRFDGDRGAVRLASVAHALALLAEEAG